MQVSKGQSVRIRTVSTEERKMVEAVVQIHLETFQGFFLTFMGKGFLRQMYSSYCAHEASGILAGFNEQEKLVGFLAYSADLAGLYKHMIARRLVPFMWYALGAFLRKPKVFMRLIRAFLKPGESRRQESYVELASIGTMPQWKGQGVGSQLIEALKARVDFDKYSYITLETDAVDNDGANAFYVKNGFSLVRSYRTHEGRKMNEYRYRG